MNWTRRDLLFAGGVAVGAALGGSRRLAGAKGQSEPRLRPPGALAPPQFLAACIRCGLCVQACPDHYGTLHLAREAGVGRGTPYVEPRSGPCWLCQDYDEPKCIASCPTGALAPVASLRDVRMGTAMIDRNRCLAYNGVMCRACWHACPFPNEAIRYDPRLRPVVDADLCVGCGLCDHACPTEISSVQIRAAAADRRADAGDLP
jgi:MauM/NapG family ferredoxin protein